MRLNNIRQLWLNYYQNKGFKKIKSAPLVHPAFPRAFNMSAGLVQLDSRIRSAKKIKPSKECLVQKCVRYFDIPKVGDNSHLSFFEMAGAFEIVEFKREKTIMDCWNFLTRKLGLDPQKIWITAFNKDKILNTKISLDSNLKKFLLGLTGKKLVLGNKETNFWTQGGGAELTDNIKLCGPQVEFFYQIKKLKTSDNPLSSPDKFLEISNTLFIEYYIDFNKSPVLKKLINPSTETVIGLERTALVFENKKDLFQTLFFSPLIKIINKKLNSEVKIIVDHLKSLVFILAEEKILPGKKDRNRIIKTLTRRLLSSFYLLKIDHKKVLPRLIKELIKIYSPVYPEIKNCQKTVSEVIDYSEEKYLKTLNKAKKEIKKYLETNNIKKISPKEKQLFWSKYGISEKILKLLEIF